MNRDMMLSPLPAGKLPLWLLRKVLPAAAHDPDILVGPGIGRDAAAIAVGDRVIVAKSDPITFASEGSAEHLVEVNANDIVCMGAVPRWMLVTALLPQGVTPADVLREFAVLRDACRQRSVELIGGHTEILAGLTKPILIGTMLGDVAPSELLQPGQARPGDVLLLSKALAIEGSALLARDHGDVLRALVGDDVVDRAADYLTDPGISVVSDAQLAMKAGGVVALHDPTEGGLATAVREIALASGTGATLDGDAIPITPETRLIAEAFDLDPLGMLASGSLLIAARPGAAPAIVQKGRDAGIPIRVIGTLTNDPGAFTLTSRGVERELPQFAVDEVARWLGRDNGPAAARVEG